jgi:hypothetical protein
MTNARRYQTLVGIQIMVLPEFPGGISLAGLSEG